MPILCSGPACCRPGCPRPAMWDGLCAPCYRLAQVFPGLRFEIAVRRWLDGH